MAMALSEASGTLDGIVVFVHVDTHGKDWRTE